MAHPNTVRGPIESEYNALRDTLESEYVVDKLALEDAYHAALTDNQADKSAALVAAGLNPDGGVPPTYDAVLPGVVTAPAVTGTFETGETATCSPGVFSRVDSRTYQWYRDDEAIGGATAATRVLLLADEDLEMFCRVTATNESGSTTSDSNVFTPTAGA